MVVMTENYPEVKGRKYRQPFKSPVLLER